MLKKLFVVLILLILFGCSSSVQHNFLMDPVTLKQDVPILVMTPKDGRYGKQVYQGSGYSLASMVKSELIQYTDDVHISKKSSIDDVSEEKLQKYKYVFEPRILHWEDRATEWSGTPDRIEVEVDVYNKKGKMLTSLVITGRSGYVVMSSGDPIELLKGPLAIALSELF